MESLECTICMENFNSNISDRRRACLNCCQHLICQGCVHAMLDHSLIKAITKNQDAAPPACCPVCDREYRRYYVLNHDSSQISEMWQAEEENSTFYSNHCWNASEEFETMKNILKQFRRSLGGSSSSRSSSSSASLPPDISSIRTREDLSSSQKLKYLDFLFQKVKQVTSQGPSGDHFDVEGLTTVFEALDYFYGGELVAHPHEFFSAASDPPSRKTVLLREKGVEILKNIFVLPLLCRGGKNNKKNQKTTIVAKKSMKEKNKKSKKAPTSTKATKDKKKVVTTKKKKTTTKKVKVDKKTKKKKVVERKNNKSKKNKKK